MNIFISIIAILGLTHVLVDKWGWYKCRFCVAAWLGFVGMLWTLEKVNWNDLNNCLIFSLCCGFLSFVIGTITDYLQSNSAIE